MIIRQHQFDRFSALARANFLDEATRLLYEADEEVNGKNSEGFFPTQQERQEVELLAQKAESFGLQSHESIGVFLQAAFFIGSDFYDVFKPASEVLRSIILNEETKRHWLQQWYLSLIKTDDSTNS